MNLRIESTIVFHWPHTEPLARGLRIHATPWRAALRIYMLALGAKGENERRLLDRWSNVRRLKRWKELCRRGARNP